MARIANNVHLWAPAVSSQKVRPIFSAQNDFSVPDTSTQVRARPLSDTNPEISKYIEAVSGPSAGGGAFASLGRRGRGDVDADSMGYDEVYDA